MESQNEPILVHIERCNNVVSGDLSITPKALNIKYAINGTGKSTIAKAISLAVDGKPLSPLKPFRYQAESGPASEPAVSGANFSSVMLFNEKYVEQYIFQPTDLVKNAFEVFVRSEDYDRHKAEIENDYRAISEMFARESPAYVIEERLKALCDLVKTNSDERTISMRASGIKSILEKQKGALFSPPEGLSEFTPFFNEDYAVDWASWKLMGITKYGSKGLCPFCAEVEKKEQTALFSSCFDKDSIAYASKLRSCLMDLAEYIDQGKVERILGFLTIDADRSLLKLELEKLISEAKHLLNQLVNVSNFNSFSITQKDIGALGEILDNMKIRCDSYDYFNTTALMEELNPINEKIASASTSVRHLQSEIAHLHESIRKQIENRNVDINHFLLSAGYTYSFDIKADGDGQAHTILRYCSTDGTQIDVDKPTDHLSWGEKNAFSLLLFMFDAIRKNADLIILDDPISSFDSNKKYAIMNRLFRPGDLVDSFYMRTVLMLTHDIEPIIDYIQVGGKLDAQYVNATFFQNLHGTLVEYPIRKDVDILSTVTLLKQVSKDGTVPFAAQIGCLRKFFEHIGLDQPNISNAYYVLSSLIHGRCTPTYDNDGQQEMSLSDLAEGINEIARSIPHFDYQSSLEKLEAKTLLDEYDQVDNAYLKLLVLRAYIQRHAAARNRLKQADDVLRKYVDETFHIENDYIYSLDFRRFQIVPEFICAGAYDFVQAEKKLLAG